MSCKVTSFFAFTFCFMFWTFMAVHHAHMKTPTHSRGIASWSVKSPAKPWYDASYKF